MIALLLIGGVHGGSLCLYGGGLEVRVGKLCEGGRVVELGLDEGCGWEAGRDGSSSHLMALAWMHVRLDVFFHIAFYAEPTPAVGKGATEGPFSLMRSCVLCN